MKRRTFTETDLAELTGSQLLRVSLVASILDCSITQLHTMIRRGEFQSVIDPGTDKCKYIEVRVVRAWIEEHRVSSEKGTP